jgi:hypothetical protein
MKKIVCPICETEENLIVFLDGAAQLRAPIKNGTILPADDITLEPRLAGARTFSASDNDETRITFYPEEGIKAELHCKKCNKAFDIPIG